jgi:hypothetical protein
MKLKVVFFSLFFFEKVKTTTTTTTKCYSKLNFYLIHLLEDKTKIYIKVKRIPLTKKSLIFLRRRRRRSCF